MSKLYHNITELVGKTPIIKLRNTSPEEAADIYVKLEAFNPGSSVKDRIALAMIEAAEKAGMIKPGDTIVEPTSGNTGIGLSWVGAAKGYRVLIVMPETMSIERRQIIQAYGAELVLTPGSDGMKGPLLKQKRLPERLVLGCPHNLTILPIPRFMRRQQGKKLSRLLEKKDLMPLFLVWELVALFLVLLMP